MAVFCDRVRRSRQPRRPLLRSHSLHTNDFLMFSNTSSHTTTLHLFLTVSLSCSPSSWSNFLCFTAAVSGWTRDAWLPLLTGLVLPFFFLLHVNIMLLSRLQHSSVVLWNSLSFVAWCTREISGQQSRTHGWVQGAQQRTHPPPVKVPRTLSFLPRPSPILSPHTVVMSCQRCECFLSPKKLQKNP